MNRARSTPTASRSHNSALAMILLLASIPVACRAKGDPGPGAAAAAAERPAQDDASQNVIRFVENPDPAPAIHVTTLDGKPLSLEDSRGKVVLLNFWATWCGPCRAEIPDLVQLQKQYKDKLQIIGLIVDDDDTAAIEKFIQRYGINYPVARSTDKIRGEYGGIPALPTSFVLDTQGRVVQKHEGLRDPVLYDTEIRALLGLPIAARVEKFEDTGQVFLQHADRATELPGVDLSHLAPEQKKAVLHKLNAEMCTCGCNLTLAQCRIYDSACAISQKAADELIEKAAHAASEPPAAKK